MLKLSVQGSAASVVYSRPLADLELGYWYNDGDSGMVFHDYPVEDMLIVDDILYVVASDVLASTHYYESYSRGKIVALDCRTMQKLWETGWRGDAGMLPVAGGDSLFYGPRRIVGIKPKKLYILDDGFYWNGVSWGYSYIDVNRILEIDSSSGAISAVGLDGIAEFYNIYSGIYTY